MWCKRERGEFPETEFELTKDYGWVHNRDPRHTSAGVDLPASDDEHDDRYFAAPSPNIWFPSPPADAGG